MTEAEEQALAALRALVRVPTVSHRDDARVDHDVFDRFTELLGETFPLLHQHLEGHRLARHALLFRWPGSGAGDPVVLMAHQDVVPVDGSAPWTHPPFRAELHDDAMWGRGTLDDKGALAAICSAVESLLAAGFTPGRDVWLFFGATEEVSGADARAAAAWLAERGVRPWFVLDEGGAIAHQAFPGIDPPLGVIGVSEKGTTTLALRASAQGGHSSTPARGGATARLARAVLRLDRRSFPARLPEPTEEMFARLAPHAPAPLRPLFAHAGRLGPALTRALVAAGPEPAALVRTTTSVTTLQGSPAHNVIATSATASVNLRLLPGDTVRSATERVRRIIRDDTIEVSVVEAGEPSPVSPMDDAFDLIGSTITEVFPDAVPTPYVMMAATDARHFTELCPRVYRFAPFRMTKAQRESIHGYDEHLGVQDYLDGVRWYRSLLTRVGGST